MKLIFAEIGSYLVIPFTWYLFRRFAKLNVAGDMLAGVLIGLYIEFATEPLWNYHYRITFYKDTPVAVLLGWGLMFTLVTFFSEKLYRAALRRPSLVAGDKRIFFFDILMGVLIGTPLEKFSMRLGVWDYSYDLLHWNWGMAPVFGMPYEVLAGYALLMTVAPTFVRYWRGPFEGEPVR